MKIFHHVCTGRLKVVNLHRMNGILITNAHRTFLQISIYSDICFIYACEREGCIFYVIRYVNRYDNRSARIELQKTACTCSLTVDASIVYAGVSQYRACRGAPVQCTQGCASIEYAGVRQYRVRRGEPIQSTQG